MRGGGPLTFEERDRRKRKVEYSRMPGSSSEETISAADEDAAALRSALSGAREQRGLRRAPAGPADSGYDDLQERPQVHQAAS